MADSDRTASLKASEEKDINWNQYNYPPLLKIIHFRPSELPQDRKTLVIMLFSIHIASMATCILNIVDNIIEGGLGILYAFLWFFIFNTIVTFLFYRGYMGLCKEKSMLRLYTIIQPIIVAVEITVSIVDFLGFNGFIRVAQLFNQGNGAAGAIALVVSILFLAIAVLSGYVFFRICKDKAVLTNSML